jgi:hypothetical protein
MSKSGFTVTEKKSKTPRRRFVSSEALTLPQAFKLLVPEYKSQVYPVTTFHLKWEPRYADRIEEINPIRAMRRCENYLDRDEIERVLGRLENHDDASIRFGVKKPGRGYHGDRGDFCLVGGAIKGKHLTLMYRSLELIGGFAYDLCLIRKLSHELGIDWRVVTIFAARAHVFALRRNSNEKLYPKLRRIFDGQD